MTGVDWHSNLAMNSYRLQLLNGIAWAANLEVPRGGAQCSIPAGTAPPPAPGAGPGRTGASMSPRAAARAGSIPVTNPAAF